MTQIERNMLNPPRNDGPDVPSVAEILTSASKAVRRHVWLVATSAVVCIVLSIAAIVAMTPIYTASSTIYIDPREGRGFQEAGGILLNSDALVVDSEVEILLSSTLAERVVRRLGLDRFPAPDPEPETPSLTARLRSLLSLDTTQDSQAGVLTPEQAAMRRAVTSILQNIEVGRLGNTYVIELTVSNPDKQLAAEIANTYVDEYLKSGLEAQADRLTQLNSWSSVALREAIDSLQSAEAKVNQFRLDNQIDPDGMQVAGAELAATNSALVALRNQRFQNEVILERVRNFLRDGSTDSDVPDVGDEGIAQIRTEILKAELEYSRVTATGNKNTPQATVLLRDLNAMKTQLVDQYQRIATKLETQIQSSIAEEQRTSERVEALRGEVAEVSQKEAKLSELQMQADGERSVYQALLTRFNETSDVLAYKSNAARVLTAAQVPAGPSSPQTAKILALGLAAGLFIGLVLTFIREQIDNGIRQPSEIEAAGLRYLGAIPTIHEALFRWSWRGRGRRDLNAPVLTGGRRHRNMARMTFAVDFPLSEFSETVRSIVFDAAGRRRSTEGAQIIAVTSTAPGEGKSTLAANLAAYFARQGTQVHLIDFDLKNPELSRLFANRHVNAALPDEQSVGGRDGMQPGKERPTNFDFSGQSAQAKASDMIEFVSPSTIATYLEGSRANYDVVILDVGSLSESSDARMCAELADYVVLAVKWGMTPVDQFERSLARGLKKSGRSVGAVLTMVPRSEDIERPVADDQNTRRLAVA